MKENCETNLEITKEVFKKVVDKFKSNNKRIYDFLFKAGSNYQNAIFNLTKRMIKDEEFPESFNETLLQQIWKQKEDKSILKNNRYIHTKNWKQRLTEGIVVMAGLKKPILNASSPFQIGGAGDEQAPAAPVHCEEHH